MHLNVMGFDVPESYTSYVLGEFNRDVQVLGERRDQSQRRAPQVGGWEILRVNVPSPLKKYITETRHTLRSGVRRGKVGR